MHHRFLHQELPYTTTVETLSWKSLKDGSARVEQTIYVERDSQKKIVLGKGGATIKRISSEARRAIEEMAGHRVHLFLFARFGKTGEATLSAITRWACPSRSHDRSLAEARCNGLMKA